MSEKDTNELSDTSKEQISMVTMDKKEVRYSL